MYNIDFQTIRRTYLMNKITVLVLLLTSFSAHAMDIRLYFTNNTPLKLYPLAQMSYVKDSVNHEYVNIDPPVTSIEPFVQSIKIDQDRLGVENYFLIWFELFDENHRYLDACLESYLAITKNSDIHFTYERDDEEPYRYHCRYKIIRR